MIMFTVLPNSSDKARRAVLTVSSREDDAVSDKLHVMQDGAGAAFTAVTFAELQALAAEDNTVNIGQDFVIEGRVLNDNAEGNGAEILNISADLQDRQRAERVLYIQNEDASAGVLVEFETPEDNSAERFDHIRLNLNGMTLTKYPATQKEPLRYELSGARVSNILETAAASMISLSRKRQ